MINRTRNNFFLIFVILVLNITCTSTKLRSPVTYELISKIEMFNASDKNIYMLKDTVKIIYYNDLTILNIPYTNQASILEIDEDGELYDHSLTTTIQYKLFIYQNQKRYGLLYDSLGDNTPEKLSVDSILVNWTFKNFDFYDENSDSLISIEKEVDNGLLKKYIPKQKPDLSYPDSTYLFFSRRFERLKFSFSKKLDSISKLKLFKVKMIYNPLLDEKNVITVPKREYLFKVKKAEVSNSRLIVDFIKENEKTLKTVD